MKTHISPTCGCSLVRLGIYTRKYKHPIFTIPPKKQGLAALSSPGVSNLSIYIVPEAEVNLGILNGSY